jgi:hypothetical protein
MHGMPCISETMCPMDGLPCISESADFQNVEVFSNVKAAETTACRTRLVKADSQLGKTAIPVSPIQHSLINPRMTIVLWTNNWQVISSSDQTEPHSAFLPRIERPPEL